MIYSRTASCTQVTLRMYITFLDLLEDGACEGAAREDAERDAASNAATTSVPACMHTRILPAPTLAAFARARFDGMRAGESRARSRVICSKNPPTFD